MKTMVKTLCLLLFAILIGCNVQKKTKDWDRENVILVKQSDSVYASAFQLAQKNLPRFIELLKDRDRNNFKFNISADYSEDEHTEQLWFKVDSMHGNFFHTKLNNVPLNLKTIKLDDEIIISKDSVKDWIVSKNHTVVEGNFAKADL